MWIGCHADSHEYARWFGDDIAVRHDSYLVDWAGLPYYRFLLTNVARGEAADPAADRDGSAVRQRTRTAVADDPLALHLGGAAGRTDRAGRRCAGSAAFHVRALRRRRSARRCRTARPSRSRCASPRSPTWSRCITGPAASRERSRWCGPAAAASSTRVVADAFIADAARMLAGPTVGDSWAAALHEAPDRGQRIDGAELDALLEALGDFVDLKCPFTLGHSRAVADARRRRRRDGRTGRRHGDADPAGGSRPRPRPHRGVQPDLVEARGADGGGVRTRAAASRI